MCDFKTATKVTKKRSSTVCYKVVCRLGDGSYCKSVYADFHVKEGAKAIKFEENDPSISRCSDTAREYIEGYITAFLKLKDAKAWRYSVGAFLKIIKVELSGDIKVFHNTEYHEYNPNWTRYLTVVCGKKIDRILKCY